MNIKDFEQIVQANSNLPREAARTVVRAVMRGMRDALVRGEQVKLRNIGSLQAQPKARRNITGLQLGRRVVTGHRIKFTSSRGLLDRIAPTNQDTAPP